MKNVSILGCGWLGKSLAISMLKKGYAVKGSTTSREKITALKKAKILPFLIDISSNENFSAFLNADILIIAITSKSIEDFKQLISQIEKSMIQKVIFISSTSVYDRKNKVVTEKDEVLDTPLSKIEKLFRENTSFETTIIRFAGLFGQDRKPGNWFQNGRKIPQPNGFVNMIHQEDCIRIIQKIIAQNIWNDTFNACSNHHPTRREFYTKAKQDLGFDTPEFEENKELKYKIISSEKLQKKLDYRFVYDDLLDCISS
ncbi:MAG: NAD(P)-binding domain-containing protein [Polaribacter sp.]